MSLPLFNELKRTPDVGNDILKFYTNIVSAYRTSAFGGKAALWNFMKDATKNMNRKK